MKSYFFHRCRSYLSFDLLIYLLYLGSRARACACICVEEPAVRPDDFSESAYLFCTPTRSSRFDNSTSFFLFLVFAVNAIALPILFCSTQILYIYIFALTSLTAFLFINVAHLRDANTPKHYIRKKTERKKNILDQSIFFLLLGFFFFLSLV